MKQQLHLLFRARRLRERNARRLNAEMHAADSLYIRDYKGAMYLFFEGRPILPVEFIKGDTLMTLAKARTVLANFYFKER